MKPQVCILRTDGTNCDRETARAFELAGATPVMVHVNQLHSGQTKLRDYQILALPGGFSNGDDVASGQILANELMSLLADQMQSFALEQKPIIGICNGFQVLVRTGLLPFGQLGQICSTLAGNTSGRFEHRWVEMTVAPHPGCVFLPEGSRPTIQLPVAHGEGRFIALPQVLDEIERQNLVILRYASYGFSTQEFPANPNGSLNAIAGICDPTGRIVGLMPHPERFVDLCQHPNWRRGKLRQPDGLGFFQTAVNYASRL